MVNGKPVNSGEALAQRLLTGEDVKALVGTRITPNKPTQGESFNVKPYLCFWKVGGGGESNLAGRTRLQSYQWRIEFHAETDEQAEKLREVVLDRLAGNPRNGIPVWRDLESGVHVCKVVDDADAEVREDGSQIAGQTFSIWFCPQV